MVTFGLGGRLLPMDFGNFGPKGTLTRSPNFWWPGGGSSKYNLGTWSPPNENIGKMGVFNQDFTPELSPFSLLWPGLPINLGNFGPQPPRPKETTGKIEGFQASTFFAAKSRWGELWGKSGLKTPPVALWVTASSQWILGILVLKGPWANHQIFGGPGGKFGNLGPRPPRRKET